MSNVFGDLIRRLRAERGLTLRDVGKMLRVSHVYVGEVERGERAPMTRDRILVLAEQLAASEVPLLVASAQQRGVVDVGDLTPRQIEAVVRYVEGFRRNRT